jgi:molybdate transport repressor ModE-like protein
MRNLRLSIRSKGSITVAAIWACLIGWHGSWSNRSMMRCSSLAVTASVGGSRGSSGAAVTSVGEEVIKLYHSIEGRNAYVSTPRVFGAR